MVKNKNIVYVLLLWFANLICGVEFVKFFINQEIIISVMNSSKNIGLIFCQNIAENIIPIAVLIIMVLRLKKTFFDEMNLKINGSKFQKYSVITLILILMGFYIFLLFTKSDKLSITYGLFYYLFFIAFCEEFMFRGVFPFLLKNHSTLLRYILPNILFALIHYPSVINFGAFNTDTFISFLLHNFLGLFLSGVAFQFLKEKSGTLWIPIIIHAILDYSAMINL